MDRVFAPRRPHIATESDSINSLITEIEIGKSIAIVSEVFKQAIGKRLLYRKLANTEITMSVGIARAKNGDLPPAGEKLSAIVRKIAKNS